MINLINISFSYQDRIVLDDISFNLAKGETIAIAGASGCGKSTLLRLISGILPNRSQNQLNGNIYINGLVPKEYRIKGKLSFMFQENALMPNLSVKDNIALPLKIQGVTDNLKVNNFIEIVGLQAYTDFLPKHLSGGMKTRVALARSFINNPDLLLLDEPFSALDISWKSKLYKELDKLRNRFNTTMIVVTHDVQEALLLANHIVVLNNAGEIEIKKAIQSNYSITERVNNISGFMNSVYSDYMIPIQNAIINGNKIEA